MKRSIECSTPGRLRTYALQAKRREIQIKGWRREKKIKLIEKINPRWEDLAENWGKQLLFRGQSLKKIP